MENKRSLFCGGLEAVRNTTSPERLLNLIFPARQIGLRGKKLF